MAQPLVKKDDDRDDEADYSPFLGIEKGAVLQEARVFNDPQLDPRRCSQVITKLLYLLNQGETFTKIEATEVFFAVTKLFQSRDIGLRRMVYLMIKELSPSADEVIIVTSSLMKDMTSKTDMYRANAIRVLCRITEGTLLTQIERYLKQAIVDKNPVVASAALVSGIHLLQTNPEIVKRWSNEVQEAVQSRAALVQFHALALLHQIRQNDRLAVSKLVTSLTKGTVRSPLAQSLLIRYTSQVIRESATNIQTGDRPFYDFLEDCEFTYLSTQILHFLGIEGPKTSDPSKYIRYIYNRVHLENATVRASAVSTLAKFGAMVDSLKPRIFVLLRRCLFDSDDEVRDRATLYLNTLGGDGSVVETDKDVKEFLFGSLDLPLVNLETSLKNYEPSEEPFDISSVPREVKTQPLAEKKGPSKKPTGLAAPPTAPVSTVDAYEKLLSSIPEFADFGKLFKSSAPVELTEAETEYSVNVVKHIFDGHVVFQYNCTNTIPEQLLEHVTVVVDASEAEEFSQVISKPLKSLPYDTPGQIFVAFEKPEGVLSVGKFSNMLRFTVKEVDPTTGEAEDDGVEDEYQLEDLEVVAADYMLKVGVSNFRNAWESMGADCERVDEYGLGPRESLAEAVSAVVNLLGLQPCEGTEVVPSNSRSHTCLLSGVYIGNVKVLVRISFGIDGPKEVAMKLAVRSEDETVSDAIHEIVASG
ncbi:hypothetical protein I3843_05G056300 [Carya illinoinensis]|uniref:Coatomer subunit gamma n=1 Tax=Carya illinoinensis TaxID=32201 RepID=A0A922F1Y0_CARIL|nr:hypothetical protein I3760_05G064300 [Carya illinoinensis]KAG6711617.1 hypothetical protein I3842_05G063500 [Carya illinoinensis]KAG7977913.1 hypothetical protein I3843_05G056300 [Carya illinoinensis]